MEVCKSYACELTSQPMDCDFHPSQNLVLASTITGTAELFRYDLAEDRKKGGISASPVHKEQIHKVSCRAARFLSSGDYFVTASLNKSMAAVSTETGKVLQRFKGAHEAAINRLQVFNQHMVASGDDEGVIRVWDTRQSSSAGHTHEFTQHTDFIADMTMHYVQREGLDNKELLIAVSGDGTMTVNDLRRRKVMHQTETDNDDEYLSVQVVRNGKKLVVGTQSGVINLFSWGAWNDCSDRFVGHPASVDSLVKVDEETIISGSEDGIIRALTILPNKMIGVVGEHEDYPVERLALSHDKRVLASASHDETVRLWDFRPFVEDDDEEEGEEEEEEGPEGGEEAVGNGKGASGSDSESGDESGSDSDQDGSDSDSDDEDEGRKQSSKHAGSSATAAAKGIKGAVAPPKKKAKKGIDSDEEEEEEDEEEEKDSDSDKGGSDDSDSDSDSDSDGGGRKKDRKRRRKGEGKILTRTEIKKGGQANRPTGLGGSGNFFADLL